MYQQPYSDSFLSYTRLPAELPLAELNPAALGLYLQIVFLKQLPGEKPFDFNLNGLAFFNRKGGTSLNSLLDRLEDADLIKTDRRADGEDQERREHFILNLVEKNGPTVAVMNYFVRDKKLSLQEKGLLVAMQITRVFSSRGIAEIISADKNTVARHLSSLVNAGKMLVVEGRCADGKFGSNNVILAINEKLCYSLRTRRVVHGDLNEAVSLLNSVSAGAVSQSRSEHIDNQINVKTAVKVVNNNIYNNRPKAITSFREPLIKPLNNKNSNNALQINQIKRFALPVIDWEREVAKLEYQLPLDEINKHLKEEKFEEKDLVKTDKYYCYLRYIAEGLYNGHGVSIKRVPVTPSAVKQILAKVDSECVAAALANIARSAKEPILNEKAYFLSTLYERIYRKPVREDFRQRQASASAHQTSGDGQKKAKNLFFDFPERVYTEEQMREIEKIMYKKA